MGLSLGLFNSQRCLLHTGSFTELMAPVVQTLDSAIHRINHYPVDKYYKT